MPALTVFKNFTTKPLAGDDFQIVCIVLGTYRVIQLGCIIPLFIYSLIQKFNGQNLVIQGYSHWCPQWHESFATSANFPVITVDEYEEDKEVTQRSFVELFVIMAVVFTGLEFAWILSVWGAATIGTPTQPMGRDEYLRGLIIGKMFFINAFPIALISIGIYRVVILRLDNYGCGDETPEYYPDETWYYVLYCVLLVTYALELAIWPAMVVNRIMRWMRSNKLTQQNRYATKAKGDRLEQCLGGLLKCLSIMCCNKSGGKELKNKGEMKDFASNLMEFANNENRIGVVLSDIFVGGKMLARVQAERRIKAIQMLQLASNKKDEKYDYAEEERLSSAAVNDRRALLDDKVRHRRSILDEDGKQCVVVEKNVLSSSNDLDVDALRNSAHYSIYAQYVYFHIRMVLEDIISPDATTFCRDFDMVSPVEQLSLTMFGAPHKHIFYANFHSGLSSTPYSIIVDEEEKSVVIAIRGTLSLEDWVIDLQYVPQPLDKVGDKCGFDGKQHHCHKGVLTRCKWLYNDIKRQRVLKHLYSSSYKEYDLVVVGHSLGGGCAQVLSLMLRPSFPSLRCYAYEPPGCIFDDVLSEDCKEWITSIVHHDDVVPRVTQPNLESLRDEFFDVVARIKVPKSRAFHDVRSPCPESHLASRNAAILSPKGEIDRDTEFYKKVYKFRNERAAKNTTSQVSTKLYIPGNIIHLVDTMGDGAKYVPYWASRYEFNQVILSKRILADHSIPPLVTILQNLNLDDVHEVRTWNVDHKEAEDDVSDMFIFVPFSNPQGRTPLILIAFSVAACVMSFLSNQGCQYVSRSTVHSYPNGTSYPDHVSLSVGLWAYNLKECIDDAEICNTSDPDDLKESAYCQAYGTLFDPDIFWKSARVFGTFSVLMGLLSLGLLSTATCTKLKRRTWIVLVVLFLLATLFQGLQFLFLKSDMCSVWTHPETSETFSAKCSLSTGGNCGIAATTFWFIIAAVCSQMTRNSTR